MKAPRNSILYIDDERENLMSFNALMRRDYPIFLAETAEEARELLKVMSVSTVLCDYRMSGMNGFEFFEWLQLVRPDVTRVLVSGSTTLEDKEAAKASGLIHDWIAKPWRADELKERIQKYFSISH